MASSLRRALISLKTVLNKEKDVSNSWHQKHEVKRKIVKIIEDMKGVNVMKVLWQLEKQTDLAGLRITSYKIFRLRCC